MTLQKSKLFSSNLKKITIIKDSNPKNLLTNLLSYIFVRTNYQFNGNFKSFIKYDQFLTNDGKGMMGVIKDNDYTSKPLVADDYFQKRKPLKKIVF